jgi:hypothetical protein
LSFGHTGDVDIEDFIAEFIFAVVDHIFAELPNWKISTVEPFFVDSQDLGIRTCV